MTSKRRTIFVVLAGIFCCWVSLTYAASMVTPVGVIVSWKGGVFVYRKGETKRLLVKKNEGIYPGDIITTEEGARAKIVTRDDSILSIGEDASINIKDYNFDAGRNQRVLLIRLVSGTVRALVHDVYDSENSIYQIETDTAVVRVRGTDFIMSAGDGESAVTVLKGEIVVRSASSLLKEDVVVGSGLTTTVKQGMAPTEPVKVSMERLAALTEATSIPVTLPLELKREGCQGCHQSVYESLGKRAYIHSDAQKCEKCHTRPLSGGRTEKKIPVRYYSRDNMVFLNIKDGMTYTIGVKVRDRTGEEALSEVLEFSRSEIEAMEDDQRPPRISDLRVEEVRGGVFYSVVVAWQTDEPALSLVEYGRTERYGHLVRGWNHLVTDHRVTIDRLAPGKRHFIRVISEDAFGNRSVSDPLRFRFKKPFSNKDNAGRDNNDLKPIVEDITVVRTGTRTALRWRSNKETAALITVEAVPEAEEAVDNGPHYPGLRDITESGQQVCLDCHSGGIHMRASHPTGVVNWRRRGVTKASGVVLGSRDAILCATCHSPHGANHGYMLRDEQENLCSSCHNGD